MRHSKPQALLFYRLYYFLSKLPPPGCAGDYVTGNYFERSHWDPETCFPAALASPVNITGSQPICFRLSTMICASLRMVSFKAMPLRKTPCHGWGGWRGAPCVAFYLLCCTLLVLLCVVLTLRSERIVREIVATVN